MKQSPQDGSQALIVQIYEAIACLPRANQATRRLNPEVSQLSKSARSWDATNNQNTAMISSFKKQNTVRSQGDAFQNQQRISACQICENVVLKAGFLFFRAMFLVICTAPLLIAFSARAQTWPGPTFHEFVGVNKADSGDALIGAAYDMNRPDSSLIWFGSLCTGHAPSTWNLTGLTNYGNALLSWPDASSNTVVMLDGNPPWSTDASTWAPEWTNYVNKVVNFLYAPPYNVRYFQIWNEAAPNNPAFWADGSWSHYFNYVHLPAAQVIHSYPGAKVVYGGYPSGASTSITDYTNQLTMYNAWSTIDVLDSHYYDSYQYSRLRAAADGHGLAGMAIWQSEVGWQGFDMNNANSYVGNEYPRALFWALNNNWNVANKYKWIFYCQRQDQNWGIYNGTNLTYHGQQMNELATLLGTGVLSPFPGITGSLSGLNASDLYAENTSVEAVRSGSKIVAFVHLSPADYSANSTVNLTFPISTNLVACVQRVDLTGTAVNLTPTGTTATSVSVSTRDAGSALSWNGISLAAGKASSFYVVIYLQSPNMALNRPVTVSSTDNTNDLAGYAVDGNAVSRWSSAYTDNEWVYVDLGATVPIGSVGLIWENSFATSFKIQVSNDASTWTDKYSTTNGLGGIQRISIAASARYVRMLGIKRNSIYGYSLWEFQVFGTSFAPINGATYHLVCNASNMAIDNGGTTNLGVSVTQYTEMTANSNQEWKLADVGSGYYNLICQTSGMALDNGGSTNAGTTNTQYTILSGNLNQYWKFNQVDLGYYNIVCEKSGMALDNGGSLVAGHVVTQWTTISGNTNQYWQLKWIR